jgi:hypothetical protein
VRRSSDIQRVECLRVVDNRLIWEERGGDCWLLGVRRTNVLDGEVSLISELYRSLDGFWGVVGSLEAWSVVGSSFVDVLSGRCRTYSAIRARPSGFAKFPGERLPIFLSAATWAASQ